MRALHVMEAVRLSPVKGSCQRPGCTNPGKLRSRRRRGGWCPVHPRLVIQLQRRSRDPAGGAEGMIVTQGGRFSGYGFYVLKGKPVFL